VTHENENGFSLIEIMMVLAIMGIIAMTAIPSMFRTTADLRLKSDGRSIAQAVGVTKMRAAARFTRARLFVDLGAGLYYPQIWDKTANDWVTEDLTARLSRGVTFGFGTIGTPPPNTQVAIQQAAACSTAAGVAIANSACVVFNSRGIPIDPVTGSPLGGTAFYVTDGSAVFATTVTATPLVRLWWTPANIVGWVQQ
jgi:prepilin-type N-terminal cleavage/methylation domain-containing protein